MSQLNADELEHAIQVLREKGYGIIQILEALACLVKNEADTTGSRDFEIMLRRALGHILVAVNRIRVDVG